MKQNTHVRKVVVALLLAGSLAGGHVSAAEGAGSEEAGLGGPAIPGVCLLSRQAVFANAAVGKDASAQIAKLTAEAQQEVLAERKPLEEEARNLESQRANLAPEKYAEQQQALARRWAELQGKADHRTREIEATRQKAIERISAEAQPVVAAEYKERKCGLLFDRGIALGGNLSGDLTAAVVQKLDKKITTLPIQREVLPMTPVAANAPVANPAR
ncbi:OmpH family outer membrane protein [Steroidobacter sp. S1-65]|uniref:OmpH family outer membrane protein n=1 Tax=Steroidobacter gossypii TaxID=2805490 RepID=A0ABS1WZF0_9GAMM|nr:OmpH family outer membrane protein [Steroidobacter gossypii]MBM0106365.1 OmpH family outer membrane protein [Steroidobacter gossypii]